MDKIFSDTKLILATPRGFCAGVERAVDIVNKAIDIFGSPIYVKHEVVHNKYVIEDLEKRGVLFIEDIEIVPENSILIYSAHGVSIKVKKDAEKRNGSKKDRRLVDSRKIRSTKENVDGSTRELMA